MDSEFIQRRWWFDDYFWRIGTGLITTGLEWTSYTCPCCGYPTLSERGAYEICPLCWWEDDGQDDPEADEVWGGPNHLYSLTKGRENFLRYKVIFTPKDRPDFFEPESWKLRVDRHKQNLMDLYYRIMTEPDPKRHPALWKEELPLMHRIHVEITEKQNQEKIVS